ncbi:hypothetical protein [Bradyrhizobium sp. AUGA SZCCT0160]|uniref:hypothetical protein n=1 Tax=Bradyrhizobium sp. AUGA SZCCT0160 TaxID=2807662 RepID=UPI001BA79EF3|nr:hypothetical protein [Bradyrhizobium sp. AUGA SZCCT0160]MBR1193326.1 hypothetical protein [Bradyrhizobium sp. AUGA SZCCT0160]
MTRDYLAVGVTQCRGHMTATNWAEFCQSAAAVMRAALENKIPLKEASDFFDNDNTITDPDLRRYVERMMWEIDSERSYFLRLLEKFELQSTERELVRYLNDK